MLGAFYSLTLHTSVSFDRPKKKKGKILLRAAFSFHLSRLVHFVCLYLCVCVYEKTQFLSSFHLYRSALHSCIMSADQDVVLWCLVFDIILFVWFSFFRFWFALGLLLFISFSSYLIFFFRLWLFVIFFSSPYLVRCLHLYCVDFSLLTFSSYFFSL